ncbi:unnamed protein product [Peronospora farinosa]|uniref:CS domain-containing protein n=1 Tax=Peronospora farinosa TaxID=134698 RepID=A0ABN8CJ72_9STRA|nr:unnamed protein product [Peronospora farinosa]
MEDTSSIAIADISALQSNIKNKGTNSYYYAHKKRENVEIHEWDGNAAPRLLKTQSLAISPESVEVMETIASFAWADGKKHVSVYLNLPGIGSHSEEGTLIEWTASSLTVKIKNYEGKTRLFVVSKLNDEISDVKTKRKEDQLVLQLVKAKELSWHSLKKEA